MVAVNITQSAEEEANDISLALHGTKAKAAFHAEIEKKINFLEEGTRIGSLFPLAGDTARQVVLSKGKILMRYDETQSEHIEIFQFIFSRNNH